MWYRGELKFTPCCLQQDINAEIPQPCHQSLKTHATRAPADQTLTAVWCRDVQCASAFLTIMISPLTAAPNVSATLNALIIWLASTYSAATHVLVHVVLKHYVRWAGTSQCATAQATSLVTPLFAVSPSPVSTPQHYLIPSFTWIVRVTVISLDWAIFEEVTKEMFANCGLHFYFTPTFMENYRWFTWILKKSTMTS